MYTFKRLDSHVAAAAIIHECGYYGGVEPADLVGVELYGLVDQNSILVACVAVLRSGVQAYVDYLAVKEDCRNKGLATQLLDQVAQILLHSHVRVVHTCVAGEHRASAKMLLRFGAKIGWPYINGVIRLEEHNG